jgi:hypothetical protein
LKVIDKQPHLLVVLAWLVDNVLNSSFEFGGNLIKNGEVFWRRDAPFEHFNDESEDDK